MALTTALTRSARKLLRFPFEEGWTAVAVGEAATGWAPKISRMGEIRGRKRRSEATAEKRCLGLRIGGRGIGFVVRSPWSGEGNTGGSGGLFVLGTSHAVSRDASVDHVVQEKLTFIERPPVWIVPDSRAKIEENRVKYVLVGGVENANDPLTVVFELIACNSPPVVSFLHSVGFVVLDIGDPCVYKSAMAGRHPAFHGE